MSANKVLTVIILLSMMSLLVSCSMQTGKNESDKAKSIESVASSETSSNNMTANIADKSSIFYADIKSQAEKYNTQPAIIALAMLICKLDDSQDYYELIKSDAKELFAQLREAAILKNVTLETLNKNYMLSTILGCEGIYVEFSSNSITYLTNADANDYVNDWVTSFQMKIAKDEIIKN